MEAVLSPEEGGIDTPHAATATICHTLAPTTVSGKPAPAVLTIAFQDPEVAVCSDMRAQLAWRLSHEGNHLEL